MWFPSTDHVVRLMHEAKWRGLPETLYRGFRPAQDDMQADIDEEGCGAFFAAACEPAFRRAVSFADGYSFAEIHLVGSCTAEVPEDADDDFLRGVDDAAFQCSCCGWWLEIEELGDDGDTCNECEKERYS